MLPGIVRVLIYIIYITIFNFLYSSTFQHCAKYKMLQTRYREGLDLVLKGIDCNIGSGEKIGNFNFIKFEISIWKFYF